MEERRAAYRVQFEDQTGLIVADIEGFWDIAKVESYMNELAALAQAAKRQSRPVGLLCRAQFFPVQAAEVAERFAQMGADPAFAPMVARGFVIDSVMSRMQVARIPHNRRQKVFEMEAEARAWLAEQLEKHA